MSDLISRSVLKEHISRYADIPHYAKEEVFDRIDDCNTAYDLKSVIEQLEELTGEGCELGECGIRSEKCRPCIAMKAIEIVKAGTTATNEG